MLRKLTRRPSPATILALVALFVALGGPAQAARWIEGNRIRPSSITSRQVADRSLGVRDLSRDARAALQSTPGRSITSAQILDGQIGADDLAPGAVGPLKLALGAVRGEHIPDGSIGAVELGPDSVDAAKITSDAVRASEIADASIDGGEIVDGGLQARDVGSYSGSFVHNFTPGMGACESATIPVTPNAISQSVLDDVIAVSPGSEWVAGVTLTARPASATEIVFEACRVGATDPPATTIRYVTFDQ